MSRRHFGLTANIQGNLGAVDPILVLHVLDFLPPGQLLPLELGELRLHLVFSLLELVCELLERLRLLDEPALNARDLVLDNHGDGFENVVEVAVED